ncbi:MAG: COQ9 family protein [Pseudomonadota bacterium]
MAISPDQKKLLDVLLEHVVFDGWTQEAVQAAARDLALSPAELDALLPGGALQALQMFSAHADQEMLKSLQDLDLSQMKVRERVAAAVRLRLENLAPHREAVRRGLSCLALPQNGGIGLKCLYGTVDAVWHGVGDRSVDYNFYSKRLLLAGVFSSTTLFWLNDKSEGQEATWVFLERRISEVLKVGGTVGKTIGRLLALPDRLIRSRGDLKGRRPFAKGL